MSFAELRDVWRREQASIDEAVARGRHTGIALQDNLIDALNQARSLQKLEPYKEEYREVTEAFRQRAAIRVRILSQRIKQLM